MVFSPLVVIFSMYFVRREVSDVTQAMLALTLGLGLNGLITDIVKLTVGNAYSNTVQYS